MLGNAGIRGWSALDKRSSPGANVNFLYYHVVRTLQNIIIDKFRHRSTRLCVETHAVQGDSRSPILVPIESSCTTSYWWLILNYLQSCTVSKLWLIIGQIFASERGVSHFNALTWVIPCQYRHNWYMAKNYILWAIFLLQIVWCIFNHFYVMCPESYRIRRNNANLGAITPFKVFMVTEFGINQKLICDFLWVINTNLPLILYRFLDIAFDRSKIAIFGYPSCV